MSLNARFGFAIVVGAIASTFAGISGGCAEPLDADRQTVVYSPDYAIYKEAVDPFLNRRCGTLDCHGQPGRALRNYGTRGLREFVPDGGGMIPGREATTEEEKQLNYQSVVALEPEMMARVVADGGNDPERLLLLQKALAKGCEGRNDFLCHKGGKVLAQGDSGYNCLTAWLKTRPGAKLTDFSAAQACKDAEAWK